MSDGEVSPTARPARGGHAELVAFRLHYDFSWRPAASTLLEAETDAER
ncbi:MAG: hypothetical protein ACLUE1_04905 [Adlercreutzia equolifaciens]